MKRYSLILCLVLIVSLSGVASAQVVLPPQYALGVVFEKATVGGSPFFSSYFYQSSPIVGGYTYAGTTGGIGFHLYAEAHGAIEFNLGPALSPTFTSQDFTARLDGLTVNSSTGSGKMNVDLFDMGDGSEDGVFDFGDFNSTRGGRIIRITHNFGGAPADFNNIDVTCAVRNDLFGTGQTDFSGFILKPSKLTSQLKAVIYDPSTPTLTITPGVPGPNKCSSGGGSSGGCFIVNAAR